MKAAVPALLAILITFLIPAKSAQAGETALRLRSAYIFQFTQYVEWPAEALAKSDKFRILVWGEDSFLQEIKNLADQKQIQGREVQVVTETGPPVHMVLAEAGDKRWTKNAKSLNSPNALLVNIGEKQENSQFVIQFFIESGRLRFEISQKATKDQNLRISSQLLKLAVVKE